MAERAEKKILELETVIRRLQNTPVAFVYVDLWKLIQVLYTQKSYDLVCSLCDMICDSLSRPD